MEDSGRRSLERDSRASDPQMTLRSGFKLGDWAIYPLEGRLVNGEEERRIQPKAMDVLLCLADAAGAVVERESLLTAVWGERAPSDEPLTRCIGELRRALGDTRTEPEYILTVPKRGYRLLQPVEPVSESSQSADEPNVPPLTAEQKSLQFATMKKISIGLGLLVIAALIQIGFERVLDDPPTMDGQKSTVLATPPRSVAVLPFVSIGGNKDDEYFADGLTEEILNSLTQLSELLVTARTSSFYFKGKDLPIPEIADTLGVAHIVEGSVRRERNRLRITAQLTRATDGFHLWSDTYERSSADIFAVQIDIAEKVASALDVVLDDDRRAQMRAAGVRNPQAFIAYQKGLELYTLAHPNEEQLALLAQANVFFEEAIERVPEFSDAHHRHSDYYTHVLLDIAAGRLIDGVSDEDIGAAPATLQTDLNAAVKYARDEGRRLNAEFDRALLTGNWQGLSAMIDRLLDKSTCTGSLWLQTIALPYDKTEEVRLFFRNQIDCDPLQFLGWVWDANALIWLGKFDAAVDAARVGLEIVPQERLRSTMVRALIAAGRHAEAESVIERDLRTRVAELGNRIMLAAARGDLDEAKTLVATFRENFVTGSENALHFYAWLGDREFANNLAADVDARPFGHMILVIAINNCYCGAPFDIEATPKFAKKLNEAGLPWPPSTPIEWPLKTW